ncbi:hypothetical protein Tsubulata_000595 [Turnera subulata]|uniref:Uncharacterized protein n=1 Tax=Turnera subulata TaxID=218843 RepID=A0A9Q0JQA1_9ROSI|nr:hypothetical protein Tsubulata_000595 [Turnera subulata]
MEVVKGKWKRNIFLKAWERCHSLGARSKKSNTWDVCKSSLQKSKSCHCTTKPSHDEEINPNNNRRRKKGQVAPGGCFSVYVGPEKQRFVIKAEYANHPLFRMLLEDAELEYGYTSEGPLLLPCEVDLFYKILAEMDSSDEIMSSPSCSSLNILCSPSRYPSCRSSNKGYGVYTLLSPSRMLKLNNHH